jgi:DNA-binding MarR family transcriptional regulator
MDNINEKAYIFGLIFVVANRLQILGDKFDDNLTMKQWLLIASIIKIEKDAPTISEVSNQIGNSRQNVKKMACILEREGFLILKKDPQDARVLRIKLTEKCMNYFKQRGRSESDFFEHLYDGFDKTLVMGLFHGLSKLTDNILELEKQYVKDEKE